MMVVESKYVGVSVKECSGKNNKKRRSDVNVTINNNKKNSLK
jgi:hypothetical protein